MTKAEQNKLRCEARKLLIEAARHLEANGEHGCACWRVADAGLLLRQFMEARDEAPQGLTTPTGRGALLPWNVLTDTDPLPTPRGRILAFPARLLKQKENTA